MPNEPPLSRRGLFMKLGILFNGAVAATLAVPIVREAATSGTGSTVIRASLMVSLAISGRPRAGARAVARVVFPLPGGPDTTTYQPAGHPSVT